MCESSASDDMTSFEVVSNMTDSMAEYSMIPGPAQLGETNGLNANFDNIQSAFMVCSQDLTDQEIQERIVELAKDNSAMKEALEQNNLRMKEHLNTITTWHNALTTSMSNQQLSLKEATDKVDVLEKENTELREKLKQLEKIPKEDEKNLIHDCRSMQTDSHTEETDLKIAELNQIIECQNLKLANLEKVSQEKDVLMARCELLQKEINSVTAELSAVKSQVSNQEKSDVEVQSLKMKISDLETQILLEQHATEAESIKHAETRHILSLVESKNHMLIQASNKEIPRFCYEQEEIKKRNLEQIDNLTAQLFDLQEQLAEREEKVTMLTSQLKTANQDYEAIPVLKSQVEVYKLDLSRVKQEKEEAECEIRRLNQEIHDLQASFGSASAPLEADGSTRPKSRWNGKLHASANPRLGAKLYVCPICNFGFYDAQAVQNHVNKCLDEA